MEEINIITKDLKREFGYECVEKDNYIMIDEFGGYIVDDETYAKIENKAIEICEFIRCSYDVDCDYHILSDGYELVVEII